MPEKTITILLADHHRLTRHGLRVLLEKDADLRVVGEAEDGWTAVRLTRELEPDLVVMDVMMPELNGIEATRRIAYELPNTLVLAVSMPGDQRFVEAMLEAGATGYLLKEDAAAEFVDAVRTVASGRRYLSRQLGAGT